MPCRSCGSTRYRVLTAEIALHFCGLNGLDKPIAWAFPRVDVCLDCGEVRFTLAEGELNSLIGAEASAIPNQPRRTVLP